MTIPFGVTAILASALEKFSERDIRWVLALPRGAQDNFPRQCVTAVGGFTSRGLPVVVIVDMETDEVFHAQKCEAKYEHLFGW